MIRAPAGSADGADSDVRVHHFGAAGTCIALHARGINVVLGRSGAGRTALCRLIAGLDPAGRARVCFGAEDVTGIDTRRRNVGLVFGEFVNYPSLTVAENIASPLRAAGISRGERTRRVADMAARVGLDAFLDRLPEALSGGQQQRVALARALVKAPAVLLLDEPLVNLDYKLRESLQEELRVLFAQTDTVVVYTTSDPREAMNLADHLVLLDAGVPIQQGAPLELLQMPTSPTAADLLCDPGLNLARARVAGERIMLTPPDGSAGRAAGGAADRAGFDAAARREQISLWCPPRLRGAGRFLLGIRPDHLQPAATDDPDALSATVLLGETTGSDTYLHLRLEADAQCANAEAAPPPGSARGAIEWVAHLDGLHALQPGSRLKLVVHEQDLLAFSIGAAPQASAGSASDNSSSDRGNSDSGTSDSGTFERGSYGNGTSDSGTSDSGTSGSGTSDSGTSGTGR